MPSIDQLVVSVRAVKAGAAKISQLLADEVLAGEDWDRAVRVLAGCREERKRLDERLLHIDALIAADVAYGCPMPATPGRDG